MTFIFSMGPAIKKLRFPESGPEQSFAPSLQLRPGHEDTGIGASGRTKFNRESIRINNHVWKLGLLPSKMYRLTCILLALLLATQAKVAPSHIAREEDPPSCVDYRSLSNIVWGCVSTTIICASAAIHPNIPPREGPFKGALRRLELIFWTVVAPEILPCWALNQLLAALTVRDVYNKAKGMSRTSFEKSLYETRTGYEKERCGIWKTVKGWFSLYEIKEAASPGGCLSGIYW